MAKQFFKDLPDTTTPLTASRLNGLLDGEEALGNLVVDSIRSKNMFDGILEDGGYTNTGNKDIYTGTYRNANMVSVKPNTTYTTSINGTAQQYVMFYYASDRSFISFVDNRTGTFTTPSNCYYVNFRCYAADYRSDFATLKVQVEEGSQVTDYIPYQNLDGFSNPISLLSDTTPSANTSYILNDSIFNYKYILIVMTSANTFANSSREYIPVSQLLTDYNYRVALSVFQSTTVYMFLDLYFDANNSIKCNGMTKGTTGWTPHIKVYGIK